MRSPLTPSSRSHKKKKKKVTIDAALVPVDTTGMTVREIVNMIKQREGETVDSLAKEKVLKTEADDLEERFLLTRSYRLTAMQLDEGLQDEHTRVESIRRSKDLALQRKESILAQIVELEAAVASRRPAVERLKREIALEKRGNDGRKKKTLLMEEQMRLLKTASKTEVDIAALTKAQLNKVVAAIRQTRALRLAGCEHLNRELRALRRISRGVDDEAYYVSSDEDDVASASRGGGSTRPGTVGSGSGSTSRPGTAGSSGLGRPGSSGVSASRPGTGRSSGSVSTRASASRPGSRPSSSRRAKSRGSSSRSSRSQFAKEFRPVSTAGSATTAASFSTRPSTRPTTAGSAGSLTEGSGFFASTSSRRPSSAASFSSMRRTVRTAPGALSPIRPASASRSPERGGRRPATSGADGHHESGGGGGNGLHFGVTNPGLSGDEYTSAEDSDADGGSRSGSRPGSRKKKKRGARGKKGVYKRTKRKKKAEYVDPERLRRRRQKLRLAAAIYHEKDDALPATVDAFEAAVAAAVSELAVLENAVRCSITVNDERERRAKAHTSGAKRAARLREELGATKAATQQWEKRRMGLTKSMARLREVMANDPGSAARTVGRRFDPVLAPATKRTVQTLRSRSDEMHDRLATLDARLAANDAAALVEQQELEERKKHVVVLRKEMRALTTRQTKTTGARTLMSKSAHDAAKRLALPRSRLKWLPLFRQRYRRWSHALRKRIATQHALAGHHAHGQRRDKSERKSARVIQSAYRALRALRARDDTDRAALDGEQTLMETCLRRVKAAQSEHLRLAGRIGTLRHTLNDAEAARDAVAEGLKELDLVATRLGQQRAALVGESGKLDAEAQHAERAAYEALPDLLPSTARAAGLT